VAGSFLGGSGSHHELFALAPIVIVLLVARCLFLRRRATDHRSR